MRPVATALAFALAAGLLVLNVLVWTGGLVDDAEPEERATPPAQPATPAAEARPEPRARPKPRAARTVSAQEVAAQTLVISASRGDCWVEARAGSATGPVLYAGTLAIGRTLRFERPKVWLRLGAASNVDLLVNGRAAAVPTGTVELTLPT